MKAHDLEVLLVEDDVVDVMSVERALRQAPIDVRLVQAGNGREALEILRGRVETAVARPFLILLDLNMPVMNGLEFLEELRKDEQLKREVVFVLSTSNYESDLDDAFKKQIAGYLVKSDVAPRYEGLVELLSLYARSVRLPG